MAADGTIFINETAYDLLGLERLAWSRLVAGAEQGRDPFHVGTFCSLSDRGLPGSRSMVLRQVDATHRLLATHADRRTRKVAHLGSHPYSSWVFYDAHRRLQVRLAGRTTVHAGADDPVAVAEWGRLPLSGRAGYCSPRPGSTMRTEPGEGAPNEFDPRLVGRQDAERGFEHFTVLVTRVEELELLYLHHAGHRRARFDYTAPGPTARHWLTP